MCKTTWALFRISLAKIPDPTQILMELHGRDLLEGKIVDHSDSSAQEDSYAVVEVEGLSHLVGVSSRLIKGILRE
jgi:hypothetical protein